MTPSTMSITHYRMTDDEVTGHDRRKAIRTALEQSEPGWMTAMDLAETVGIDRATVYHHAKRMVAEGTAALGFLHLIGEPGRPARVVIDPDRLADIPSEFEHTVVRYTGVTDTFPARIEFTETPDEYVRPRLGPIATALRDGLGHDELATAIARTTADAILAELHAGTLRLVIEPTPAASASEEPR